MLLKNALNVLMMQLIWKLRSVYVDFVQKVPRRLWSALYRKMNVVPENKNENVEISASDADGIRAKIQDKFTSVRDN